MKRFLAILLTLLLIFSLAACDKEPERETETPKTKHRTMIKEAVEELKDHWKEVYDEECPEGTDRYFEIKNTRVVTLKANDIEQLDLKDIAYIVEFEIYADYFGSAPYYANPYMYNNVVVYKAGNMEVTSTVIHHYRSRTYETDYSDFIKSIDDYHDKYNWSGTLD